MSAERGQPHNTGGDSGRAGRPRHGDIRPRGSAITCEAGVTRAGEYVPCGKPAVGLYADPHPEGIGYPPYPVCVHHLRKDGAVGLAQVIEELQ